MGCAPTSSICSRSGCRGPPGGSSTGVGRGVAVRTGGTAVVTGSSEGAASSGATRLAAASSFDFNVFVASPGAGGSA